MYVYFSLGLGGWCFGYTRFGALGAQWDELQLAASENRIRMKESLIDPYVAAGCTAMAQAIDDAFGQDRVDESGASCFLSGPLSATRSLSSQFGCCGITLSGFDVFFDPAGPT